MGNEVDIETTFKNDLLIHHFDLSNKNPDSKDDSPAYQWSSIMMESLMKKYLDHTGQISFQGDIESLKHAFEVMFKSYELFLKIPTLADPNYCKTKFESDFAEILAWNAQKDKGL